MSSTIKNNNLINNIYDVSQIFSAKSILGCLGQ